MLIKCEIYTHRKVGGIHTYNHVFVIIKRKKNFSEKYIETSIIMLFKFLLIFLDSYNVSKIVTSITIFK